MKSGNEKSVALFFYCMKGKRPHASYGPNHRRGGGEPNARETIKALQIHSTLNASPPSQRAQKAFKTQLPTVVPYISEFHLFTFVTNKSKTKVHHFVKGLSSPKGAMSEASKHAALTKSTSSICIFLFSVSPVSTFPNCSLQVILGSPSQRPQVLVIGSS